ncbi:MAG: hypothetical protein JNL90_06150 [Planctomycetes bacterium]|nr:hypothetical protein [Planctomycetota bacterium]
MSRASKPTTVRRAPRLALLLAPLLWAPGCIAPSVLDDAQRLPETTAPARLDWRPAQAADLHGYWESSAVEGEAAVALRKLYYLFASDGRYTGAALVAGDTGPQFQTLDGRWTLADGVLDLGDGATAEAQVAPGWLRLVNEGGTLLLERSVLE